MDWSPELRQLKVLAALDSARTQYYHVLTILITGLGFFTDAYDLFCISVFTRLLGRIYYPNDEISDADGLNSPGQLPISVNFAVTGTALCGTLVGQIFFGWLADKVGRKRVYGITLIIMFVFSIASGLSMGRSSTSVLATLCFFRFWLGFGIGGEYPISATIMSEYSNTKARGAFIAAVFAMQGLGILTAGTVGVILATIFNRAYPAPTWARNPVESTVRQADFLWRIMFMLGAIPAAATYWFRMRMPETARYTALVTKDTDKAAEDMMKVLNMPVRLLKERKESHVIAVVNVEQAKDQTSTARPTYGLFSPQFVSRHGCQLLGCAGSWFLLDMVYYSQVLYQNVVFTEIGLTPAPRDMNALKEVFMISRAQCLVALFSTVPGYWFTVLLVDRIGRIPIQMQGFLLMAACTFSIAIWYPHLITPEHRYIFLGLYALTFFFANFGPNATTFIIPAEMFPARLRATCHGISAACGKAGAIVGSFGFLQASQSPDKSTSAPLPHGIGLRNTLYILASMSIAGALFTLLLPETNNKSLERISQEKTLSYDDSDDASIHPHIPPLP